MKLVRYGIKGAGVSAGVVVDDHVVALGALDGAPTDVTALLAAGPDVTADVARKATSARQRTPLSEVVLHAPIPAPSKYLAIGFNFTSHLAEIQQAATQPQYAEQMARFKHLREAFPDQKLPTFFNKQVSCITGPYDPILAPYDSPMLDYEGELVAVIGQRVRRADAATALASVAGYTVGNDVSVRDWQQDTPTMWPGKSFDTHGPIGPWVITADEVRQRLNETSPFLRARYSTIERKKEFLENMVRNELLAQEAIRQGFDKSPAVREQMKRAMIQELIKRQLDAKLSGSDIPDEELKKFYEAHIDEFVKPERARVLHIFLPATDAKQRAEARKHADEVKAKFLSADGYTIFKGGLVDNKGKTVIAAGTDRGQKDPELEKMDYLVEGVLGATS